MEQKTGLSGATVSLVALLSGCASGPYTQVQLGYANTRHEKDLGGPIDLLCVRARGGAKIGAKDPDRQEINDRRELIIRKIKKNTNSYFQQNPDDPRKSDWNKVLKLEKAGEKIVLKQDCEGNVYFGLDGTSQVLNPK